MKGYCNKYGVKIAWYIMTSKENNSQTIEFFKKHNYFEYGAENIKFFIQTQLPMLSEDGKILLESKSKVRKAADGHGGIFKTILNTGMLEDMKNKNIKWIYIGAVDNILSKMVDSLLVGITIDKKLLAGAKSLIKAYPEEKVGVFCKKNGKPSVVEYTEISKEMAEEKNENGELKFSESHVLCNLFNIETIIQMANANFKYHVAHKKSNYIDTNGNLIRPEKPNAYKFENFLFDAFERLDDIAILRVKREDEFAPIKNAEGVDSPETARKLYDNFKNKNK